MSLAALPSTRLHGSAGRPARVGARSGFCISYFSFSTTPAATFPNESQFPSKGALFKSVLLPSLTMTSMDHGEACKCIIHRVIKCQ